VPLLTQRPNKTKDFLGTVFVDFVISCHRIDSVLPNLSTLFSFFEDFFMPRTKWDTLEKEWDKAKPLTMTKTGVSAKLRAIEVALKGYSRGFVKETSGPDSAKSDDERFQKGLAAHVKTAKGLLTIDPRVAKNPKTKAFIDKLIADLEEEKKFWDGNPCQKEHGKTVRFAEPEKDPEKPFQNLVKNLTGAASYLDATNKFVKAIESCFGQDGENRRKLTGFAGHFKAEVIAIGKALVKDPPDLPSARGKLDRLKPIAAQLQTDFKVGGAMVRKAVEECIIGPLEAVLVQQEQRLTAKDK